MLLSVCIFFLSIYVLAIMFLFCQGRVVMALHVERLYFVSHK